jgi:hypothetical protein
VTGVIKGLCAGLAAIGIASAGILGNNATVRDSDSMKSSELMSITMVASSFARQQFEHTDSDHARQAVQLQISLLKQIERVTRDDSHKGEFLHAYTRLAMIEETVGNKEAEYSALDLARGYFKHVPGQEVTDEELKNTVRLMDGFADRM